LGACRCDRVAWPLKELIGVSISKGDVEKTLGGESTAANASLGNPLNLDVPTLKLTLSLLIALTTALLGMAALSARAQRELKIAALTNACICCGFMICALPGVPLWLHGVLGYGVLGAGLGLACVCLVVFDGKPASAGPVVAMAALTMLGPLWYAYAEPSLDGRRLSASFAAGCGSAFCAVSLLRSASQEGLTAKRITAAGFGTLGAALMLSTLLGATGMHMGPQIEAFNLLGILLGEVAVMFGFVLMLENRRAQAMERLSMTDALTGLLNRSGLQSAAARRLSRAAHQRMPVSVLTFDADHFKRVNDAHGHPVGDEVLRQLASRTLAALRPDDLIARYGGEEFVVLMMDTDPSSAHASAERLRMAVAQSAFEINGLRVGLTVSLGLAHSQWVGHDLHALVAAADAALYEAKRAGRNCTRVADPARSSTVTASAVNLFAPG
jgi:diguanylate cyclase (GGDEF)-like protein